jgi:two-component system chemotaxis response regulator CheB
MKPIRLLIVDDSIMFRMKIEEILCKLSWVEVVGAAANGKIALHRISSLKPDLITLDLQMPEMDGLELLANLHKTESKTGVIVVSAHSPEGGALTLKALELGAFDYVLKPQGPDYAKNEKELKERIIILLQAFINRNQNQAGRRFSKDPKVGKEIKISGEKKNKFAESRGKSQIIAIGISTGGPPALAKLLQKFPKNISVPIMIVQHMPPIFTRELAKHLDSLCQIRVKEAENGEIINAGIAYIAPGGMQMKITGTIGETEKRIFIAPDPPENGCRPSVDYLFRSVAEYYREQATAVIMTGMGMDGLQGLKAMKKKGAWIIAQDEASCTVFSMSKKPIAEGIVDVIAPLDEMADEILETVQ